ncbi:MAG: dihydropteroate synthase [Chloroflexia bacterium]|jgi:dihydropteroate synthase|nr:dihydropteroate synthase [Chloroflexia bacterium]
MTSSGYTSYNARVITLDQATIASELALVGAQKPGQMIISAKSDFLVVKLDNLSCVAANVLKQEMLARGGDCAVHHDCLTLERDTTSVLLTGAREQYDSLVGKLHAQGFDLPEASRQIAALLANIGANARPLQLGPFVLPRGVRTLVMGILNVTPDSFSGDSLGDDVEAAVAQARRMHAEGADILDIGGESTRPGSDPVPVDEELRRVLPVIERLSAPDGVPLPISIDTRRSEVARRAVQAGAVMINDITGLRDDPALANVAAETGAGLVLMHIQGTPSTMQKNPHYDDLLGEVTAYLRGGVDKAISAGVNRERIWVDPGIGFGKTLDHNLELLRRLGELRSLGCGILVGTSRKSFLGRVLARSLGGELPAPEERVAATGATTALAIASGAEIVRVHDVAHNVQVARIADAIVRGLK